MRFSSLVLSAIAAIPSFGLVSHHAAFVSNHHGFRGPRPLAMLGGSNYLSQMNQPEQPADPRRDNTPYDPRQPVDDGFVRDTFQSTSPPPHVRNQAKPSEAAFWADPRGGPQSPPPPEQPDVQDPRFAPGRTVYESSPPTYQPPPSNYTGMRSISPPQEDTTSWQSAQDAASGGNYVSGFARPQTPTASFQRYARQTPSQPQQPARPQQPPAQSRPSGDAYAQSLAQSNAPPAKPQEPPKWGAQPRPAAARSQAAPPGSGRMEPPPRQSSAADSYAQSLAQRNAPPQPRQPVRPQQPMRPPGPPQQQKPKRKVYPPSPSEIQYKQILEEEQEELEPWFKWEDNEPPRREKQLSSTGVGSSAASSATPAARESWRNPPPEIMAARQETRSAAATAPPQEKVSLDKVIQGLDILYPPNQLESRNAKSRTDGYWPFMKGAGSEAPQEYTYGEFDIPFFSKLLDAAAEKMGGLPGKVFCDVGSGAGRLVLGAAALHPQLRSSQGVEILPGIHHVAEDTVATCRGRLPRSNLPLAPIKLTCGSISDPKVDVSDIDLFFVFSTCMSDEIREDIAKAIGKQCKEGSLIICTDYELITERTLCPENGKHFQLQEIAKADDFCEVVGGVSTAYTYRLIESAAGPSASINTMKRPAAAAATAPRKPQMPEPPAPWSGSSNWSQGHAAGTPTSSHRSTAPKWPHAPQKQDLSAPTAPRSHDRRPQLPNTQKQAWSGSPQYESKPPAQSWTGSSAQAPAKRDQDPGPPSWSGSTSQAPPKPARDPGPPTWSGSRSQAPPKPSDPSPPSWSGSSFQAPPNTSQDPSPPSFYRSQPPPKPADPGPPSWSGSSSQVPPKPAQDPGPPSWSGSRSQSPPKPADPGPPSWSGSSSIQAPPKPSQDPGFYRSQPPPKSADPGPPSWSGSSSQEPPKHAQEPGPPSWSGSSSQSPPKPADPGPPTWSGSSSIQAPPKLSQDPGPPSFHRSQPPPRSADPGPPSWSGSSSQEAPKPAQDPGSPSWMGPSHLQPKQETQQPPATSGRSPEMAPWSGDGWSTGGPPRRDAAVDSGRPVFPSSSKPTQPTTSFGTASRTPAQPDSAGNPVFPTTTASKPAQSMGSSGRPEFPSTTSSNPAQSTDSGRPVFPNSATTSKPSHAGDFGRPKFPTAPATTGKPAHSDNGSGRPAFPSATTNKPAQSEASSGRPQFPSTSTSEPAQSEGTSRPSPSWLNTASKILKDVTKSKPTEAKPETPKPWQTQSWTGPSSQAGGSTAAPPERTTDKPMAPRKPSAPSSQASSSTAAPPARTDDKPTAPKPWHPATGARQHSPTEEPRQPPSGGSQLPPSPPRKPGGATYKYAPRPPPREKAPPPTEQPKPEASRVPKRPPNMPPPSQPWQRKSPPATGSAAYDDGDSAEEAEFNRRRDARTDPPGRHASTPNQNAVYGQRPTPRAPSSLADMMNQAGSLGGGASPKPLSSLSSTSPDIARKADPEPSSGGGILDAPRPADGSVTAPSTRTKSWSGVTYKQVEAGLDILYPPSELPDRNAASRADGYWPFVQAGEEAPEEFTYGEFDATFFAQIVDEAAKYLDTPNKFDGKIVCDIGSGAGRLVLGAAALHPNLEKSQGVEILPGIHEMAIDKVGQCQSGLPPLGLSLAPIELTCGSIQDPSLDISNVDMFFIASTCMSEPVLEDIASAIGRQCHTGTLVISTDYELPTKRTLVTETGECFKLEKLSEMDGYCWGGVSTAFIYRLEETAAYGGVNMF